MLLPNNHPTVSISASPSTLHILVLEDNKHDFVLIQSYLRGTYNQRYVLYNRETLAAGIEFLQKEESPIDLLLVDLGLPDSQGYDTFEQLHQQFPQYPIVVLTGLDEEDPAAEKIGLQAIIRGAQDFIGKNQLSPQILRRTVRYAIERKQMLQRLEEAHSLALMGSWEISLPQCSLSCSKSLHQILALPPTDQSLNHLDDYLRAVAPEDRVYLQGMLANLIQAHNETSFQVEHRLATPGAQDRAINFRAQLRLDSHGRPCKILCMSQDITQRKQIEQLEREKEVATQTAQMRQDFLAKTSHEIRTPLNPILLLSDMLLETPLNAEQKEHIRIIHSAGETLLALVNDILDLAKIEAGKIEFTSQPFNLREVFRSVSDMLSPHAKKRNLTFEVEVAPEVPPQLKGDSVRLTQILLNLVSNAIKFTQKGEVKVTARQVQDQGNEVRLHFAVEDTGVGIPPDMLKVIFESFQQIDSEITRQQGGTGLGLTIVRQLVKLQGGDIDVQSKLGEGSSFTFELPFLLVEHPVLLPPHATSGKDQPAVPTSNGHLNLSLVNGLRVLLVEDNPLNQMVTSKLLSNWHIVTEIANDGRQGVEMLAQNDYHLVLMDVQMPEMDGYQATRYIRQRMTGPKSRVPIIALTANAFKEVADECIQAGMDDYLSKPIEIEHLFHKIVAHLPPDFQPHHSHRFDPAPAQSDSTSSSPQTDPPSSKHQENRPMAKNVYTNLEYLKGIAGGDRDMMRLIVEKFLASTPEIIDAVKQSLAAGDQEQFARDLHKLKGSVSSMGMEQTTEQIKAIEHILKQGGDSSAIPDLTAQVIAETEGAMVELAREFT